MDRRNIEAVYPLSPMQQGMLFHSLAEPDSGVYFEQLTCSLRGDLDVPAFVRAWERVVERHGALRTSFVWKRTDKTLQVVHRRVEIPFEIQDWRVLDPSQQEERLESFLLREKTKGFNPAKAPLLRLALMRTGEDSHRFVLCNHHLLMDGWSMPLVMKEVLVFYETFRRGESPKVEPVRPYREYIQWLQRQDKGPAGVFWAQALEGVVGPTPLNSGSYAGRADYSIQERALSSQSTTALQLFTRQHGLTLNTLVQGAWGLLLSRYSGEEDVLFGATVSGRPADLPGAESMVGLFINTLPVRLRIGSEETVLTTLKRLMAQQTESRQYEYCSLTEIQGWSRVPRDLPLFESILVFENYPVDSALPDAMQGQSLRVENVRTIERTNYPLTAVCCPGERAVLKIAYDAHRFDPDTIGRMLLHWGELMAAMAAHPELPLWKLSPLTGPEQHRLVSDWNATSVSRSDQGTIQRFFEEQAARTPDATAVVFIEGQSSIHLTYGALNRRANQLASYLKKAGVGPETVVGICVERSLEMAVGLLGILKAGGAYLPLDPSYPAERLSYMVEDSGVRVILTQSKVQGSGFRVQGFDVRKKVKVGQQRGTGNGEPGTTDLDLSSNLEPRTSNLHLSRCRLARDRRGIRREPPRGCRPIQPGLCDLHLRLHRDAQGYHGTA